MGGYDLRTLPSPYAPKRVASGQDPVAAETNARAAFFNACSTITTSNLQGGFSERKEALSRIGHLAVSSRTNDSERGILIRAANQVFVTSSPQDSVRLASELGLGAPSPEGGPVARWLEKACGVPTHEAMLAESARERAAARQSLPTTTFGITAGEDPRRRGPSGTTLA